LEPNSKKPANTKSGVIKRSIMIAGHRTSVSMEQLFWIQLKALASQNNSSVAQLIIAIDQERGRNNLSSAIRLHVLERLIERADPAELSGPNSADCRME
jgi:predicted DNA-binding ribbon-helix-helix protein